MEAIPGSADGLRSEKRMEGPRPTGRVRPALIARTGGDVPDAHTQLEALLDQVWRCEAGWRFDDRMDLASRLHRH
jgi:hypothetical protein